MASRDSGCCDFSDGNKKLVSFCRGMCLEPNLNDLMVQDCPYWPQPASSWGTAVTLCACGERMVRLLGGQASVERLMQPHSDYIAAVAAAAARKALLPASGSGSSEERVEVLLHSGVTAVRLCARFDDWAVLNSKGRCQTCPSRQGCRHTPSEWLSPSSKRMTAEMAEAKLYSMIVPETGNRRPTCLFDAGRHIAANPKDDPVVSAIFRGALAVEWKLSEIASCLTDAGARH